MTIAEIRKAKRAELVAYLEDWGTACYSDETTAELRVAALENARTEAHHQYDEKGNK